MRYGLVPDRVRHGSSRAIGLVACARVGRRIASPRARRMRDRRSPNMAWGMGVACRTIRRQIACGTVCRRITSRHVSARVGDLGVSTVVTVERAEHPSSAMSRPNMAL